MSGREQVAVHLDAEGMGGPRPVGTLSRERSGARSVVSFAYEPAWVADRAAFSLDPLLPLHEGEQFPPVLPGAFADSAPDRWGRVLQERREAEAARREKRDPRHLDDWDFLLGVHDPVRMGALRLFRDGSYIDDEPFAVPPVTRLRELEQLARKTEEGLPLSEDDEERWVRMLLAPGSSLGGARPKANFREEGDGSLWIAKFPSREDRHDVGAWEFVLSRLAGAAGIAGPEARLLRLGSGYGTFCARHFDRAGEDRLLYASAMTLSGRRDHEQGSYLDIVRAIVTLGDPDAIEADLGQLFRRAAFNLLAADRDDHLRNHGFLRGRGGWRLAPAFDVNPSPRKEEHSLAFDDRVRAPELEVLLATAPHYRLAPERAGEIVAEVEAALAGWRAAAAAASISRDEVDLMATVLPRS